MKYSIILTNYFVRSNELNKLPMIEFSIEHFRKNNPNAYIILSGHGVKPNTSLCDYVLWEDKIDESELGMGHPRMSYNAINHALSKGINLTLKTTSYSLCLYENVCEVYEKFLNNKKLIITQETEFISKKIGDLFMFGDLNFLKKCYDLNKWNNSGKNGLESFGKIVDYTFNQEMLTWPNLLRKYFTFENIFILKWIDLRVHWHKDLKFKKDKLLINNLENYNQYLWGHSNGKNLKFDTSGNLISNGSINWVKKSDWDRY